MITHAMIPGSPGISTRWFFFFLALLVFNTNAPADTGEDDLSDRIVNNAVAKGERTWERVKALSPDLSSRQLFSYGLILCEADQNTDRLGRLFEVAARMQNRDEGTRGYGNFRWKWADGEVLDYNAVEFCLQNAALIELMHGTSLSGNSARQLQEIFEYARYGCLRHHVPESYTNIALMNAQNLILLGQVLEDGQLIEEGKARLSRVCTYTYECGLHEYCSPTYYGVDLDCLVILQAFAEDPQSVRQAEALLELFWTDLSGNWYAEADKLAGTRSRDYDYLRGLGNLDRHLWRAGWLDGTLEDYGSFTATLAEWVPDSGLKDRNRELYPRLIRQSWGASVTNTRTHQVYHDITLSTSGANYGAMDLPLTVDLPGDRRGVRGYFIPDARRDPYGKKKIPAGGGHEKTLHVKPFWAGTQLENDALGLVLYRREDIPPNPPSLESHFVFPLDVDSIWIGQEKISIAIGKPSIHEIGSGTPVVFHKGTAAAGIRIPWSRNMTGESAPAALIWDGNQYHACRITVAHHSFWGLDSGTAVPGAAFWIRIGSGLETPEESARWRRAFAEAVSEHSAEPEKIRIGIEGENGRVAVTTAAPFTGCLSVIPPPGQTVLEINGDDIGKRILEELPAVQKFKKQSREAVKTKVKINSREGTFWEAESGRIAAPMRTELSNDCFGNEFVWCPGRPGEKGSGGAGRIIWKLTVPESTKYFLWGRVFAPTPSDDSFRVRILTDSGEPVGLADWHTETHTNWEWTPVKLNRAPAATPLMLPKGKVTLELRAREDGTRIDRLFITADPSLKP